MTPSLALASLAVIIAIAGLTLIALLAQAAVQQARRNKLAKHRGKHAGLADLLNYAALVDDGVVLAKNGSLMATWIYRAEDAASSTNEQREALSARINQAFVALGSGWMIHVDAVRRSSVAYSDRGASHFPDPVTQAIDDERRAYFQQLGTMYEGFFVLTATWFPPSITEQKIKELVFDDDRERKTNTERTYDILTEFKRKVRNFEDSLSSAIKLTRLKGVRVAGEEDGHTLFDDQLRWIQRCVTGENQPIALPSNPMYLDAIIGGRDLWTGTVPKIGRNFIQVVAIEGFPLESTPGILNSLSEVRCEYRWNTRFIFMDTHEAVQHLDKFRKKWRQKMRGFFDQVFQTNSGRINQDAVAMVEDAETAIAEVSSGLVAQGYYTSVVVLMGEDRDALERDTREFERKIMSLGFVSRVEELNAMEAYLGSLPGHGVENVRRPIMNTLNLSDLLPSSSIWTGNAIAPCPFYPENSPALMECVTHGSTPFHLNLHVRDVGHTLIFGPTGAGKSTLLSILAAQLRRYPDMSIFAFDKGMSMYPLCKAVGGLHFTVAGDEEKLAFCPLQFLGTPSDRAWAAEWIESILALNGVVVTSAMRKEIAHALDSMHKTGAKMLTDFSHAVQDQTVRDALTPYCVGGTMGHLLDAREDGLSLSQFTTFEVEELMGLGEKYALPVLLYLFRRIERALKGQPAAIVLDEAWVLLGNDVFRDKIREWLKVLRKANCAVIMATQSITDAANSGILDVLVESTATKIYLPNPEAGNEDAQKLYSRLGLNRRQIEILRTALPKRQYYAVSENGRRLFELALGPVALAFVGASSKEEIATIKGLERSHGNGWVKEWLATRSVYTKIGVAA
ncbi:VirB4 family type IV secretion/conjugal transfer ATPase [Novosphingobium terrae]|uniref:VirB4 family type IV secretion/conjugal transfer ATPase n=1 Tax=Novosphingobium terrae TaxID=2726189 RepID=UPI00197FDA40|nr:VirB4 family type IV secretion/conjugal transfer ATPase [Novosphingobium terrae]